VVFKNQARGTEDKKKKEFVNVSSARVLIFKLETNANILQQDLLRSDFHRRFMGKYVR
jgi:protein CWC15